MSSHTVQTTAVESPTPDQMKQFWVLVGRKIIHKGNLQDFLRNAYLDPQTVTMLTQLLETAKGGNPYAESLQRVEAACMQYHPEIINDVLEVCAPYADPAADFEPRDMRELDFYTGDCQAPGKLFRQVQDALFWVDVKSLALHHVSARFVQNGAIHVAEHVTPDKTVGAEIEGLFNEGLNVRRLLDSEFDRGAKQITAEADPLFVRAIHTKARHFELIPTWDSNAILRSITTAFKKFVTLLAVGDTKNGMKFKPFLKFQTKGTPIICQKDGDVHMLAGPHHLEAITRIGRDRAED
jgi:hypothetical protein